MIMKIDKEIDNGKILSFFNFCSLYVKTTGKAITQEIVDRFSKIREHILDPSTHFDHPNGVKVKGNIYKFFTKQLKEDKRGLMHLPIEGNNEYCYTLHTIGIVEDCLEEKVCEVISTDGFLAFCFELDKDNYYKELKNYE